MLADESLLGFPVVIAIFVITFVAVFLILYCIDCGKKAEYQKLDRGFAESRDVEVQEKKILQRQRSSARSDAQYYVRSLTRCQLMDEYDLWEIGYRKERTNFLIKLENRVSLLSLVTPGINCAFPLKTEQGRSMFRQVITSLKHPYIQLVSKSDFWIEQYKSVVISYFSDEGSLRDFLYKSKPTAKWDVKYNKTAQPLSKGKASEYSRQILEALLYMKQCGIPYTHLHSGNVIIRNDVARITNIENGLLNLERQHERLYRQFKKKYPNKFEKMDIDTISLGALIYEIVTGYTLKNLSQLESYPPTAPKEALEVINIIMNDAEKTPTLEEISQMPFLANAKLKYNKPEPVEFDDKIKRILTAAKYEAKQLQGGLMSSSGSPGRGPRPKTPPKRSTPTKQTASTPVGTPKPSSPSPPPAQSSNSPASPPPPAQPLARSTPSAPTPPPPAGGPPPPPPPSVSIPAAPGRNELLGSIRGFSGQLKKTVTNDRSSPIV